VENIQKVSWHTLSSEHVVSVLKTDIHKGLSHDEVQNRLATYGYNAFEQKDRDTLLDRFVVQLKSPLVFILLFAGIATIVLGEHIDSLVIFIALAVNISIGLFQEARASRAFEKLASSQERTATVVRDGHKRVLMANDLVPGDIVELHAGALIPADIYLLEVRDLNTSEAALTGESVAVVKEVCECKENAPITDQRNMAWMGTLVASGEGLGVVVGTGSNTEIGKIADSLSETVESRTPIQKNIKRLARFLSLLVLGIVVLIFVLGLFRGEEIETMILLAIAVAVSVIPEGLPAAVTAVLAIGMEKILSRGGLVRNLLAAETLGSTTVILTDKTGTLTQALMTLKLIITASGISEKQLSSDAYHSLTVALEASDAFVEEKDDKKVVRGRPIERAIVRRARQEGLSQDVLFRKEKRIDFLPFSSSNRFAISLNETNQGNILFISGAPEKLLNLAKFALQDGKEVEMTDELRKSLILQLEDYARRGVRFIAVGYKKTFLKGIPEKNTEHSIDGLVFGALLGFEDPIREDVPDAIRIAKNAGAEVIMITGDNPKTAQSIAVQAGITNIQTRPRRGSEVDLMSDDELREELKKTRVFARMLPEQKLRIVKLLQDNGEVVAMTGDGVNDAPALKRADIGLAVGSGTEVAQEASDLILLNNSFSIIVAAIEEGRRIIDNLKKVVTHLLSTSFHEVFIIAGAIIIGLPLPVLPVQILWVNILEEGFLNFGFAFEPAEQGLMNRDPRAEHTKTILTKEVKKLILIAGIITGIFSLGLYLSFIKAGLPIEEIRTMMFAILSLDAIFFAVSLKHLRKPFWHASLVNNAYLLFALGVSVLGLILTLSVPVLRDLLSLEILDMTEVIILVGVGLFNLLTIEISKHFAFK